MIIRLARLKSCYPMRMKKKPLYSIALEIGDRLYYSKGNSLDEAVETLDLPQKLTNKGAFVVNKGEKQFVQFMYPAQLKRFTINPLTRALWIKRAHVLLS